MDSDLEYTFKEFTQVEKTDFYDYVTCFETLEHCHPPEQRKLLGRLVTVLKPKGKIVISVPIEIGPIALLKNLFRLKTKDASFPDFTLWNIIKAVFLKPTTWHRDTLDYPGHFGWDHRKLEKVFAEFDMLVTTKKSYIPFNEIKTFFFNSQGFYTLTKK